MGARPIFVDADFYAGYVLASVKHGASRWSFRFDAFGTSDRDHASLVETNTEHGRAWAIGWLRDMTPRVRLAAEFVQITGDRAAAQQSGFDPVLTIIIAQPKQGVDPQKCEAAIFDELEKIKKAPITDQELEKAKNIRLVEFYQQMRTINGRANTIGTYEVFFGDYSKVFDAAKNYAAVTQEDVQRVAQKYFGANNRTVATLIPANEHEGGAKQ